MRGAKDYNALEGDACRVVHEMRLAGQTENAPAEVGTELPVGSGYAGGRSMVGESLPHSSRAGAEQYHQ